MSFFAMTMMDRRTSSQAVAQADSRPVAVIRYFSGVAKPNASSGAGANPWLGSLPSYETLMVTAVP